MKSRIGLFVLRRLGFLILVLLGTTFLAFFLTRLLPGNPIAKVVSPYTSEEERAAMMHAAHLDLPFYKQFGIYIGNVVQGDLGISYSTAQPIHVDLFDRFPASFELVFYSMLLIIIIGVPMGMISAVRQGKFWDQFVRIFSVVGVSIPIFWLGLVLLRIFFTNLGWLPGPEGRLPITMLAPQHLTGMYTLDALFTGQWEVFKESVKHLVLPIAVLTFSGIAPIARVTRSAMMEVLESDYIRTALSLGIPKKQVLWNHGFKNALIPILTMITAVFGYSLGGSVLVEIVFSWPGLGQYAYQATLGSDFPAIQGFILFYTAFYVLVYLALDIMIAIIDPRVDFNHG